MDKLTFLTILLFIGIISLLVSPLLYILSKYIIKLANRQDQKEEIKKQKERKVREI